MCWGFPRRRPKFLSTPSARRATPKAVKASVTMSISIHALREEGDVVAHPAGGHKVISIHALREEGDQEQLLAEINRRRFLSTPSARRATRFRAAVGSCFPISIHALREEGDPRSH